MNQPFTHVTTPALMTAAGELIAEYLAATEEGMDLVAGDAWPDDDPELKQRLDRARALVAELQQRGRHA